MIGNRISILDKLFSSDDLESFYRDLSLNQGKSLELNVEITKRSYFHSKEFLKFKNQFIMLSPFANIFFNNQNGTYPDLNLLRLGLDIDSTFDTHRRL
jgi:hypothetical protein